MECQHGTRFTSADGYEFVRCRLVNDELGWTHAMPSAVCKDCSRCTPGGQTPGAGKDRVDSTVRTWLQLRVSRLWHWDEPNSIHQGRFRDDLSKAVGQLKLKCGSEVAQESLVSAVRSGLDEEKAIAMATEHLKESAGERIE